MFRGERASSRELAKGRASMVLRCSLRLFESSPWFSHKNNKGMFVEKLNY